MGMTSQALPLPAWAGVPVSRPATRTRIGPTAAGDVRVDTPPPRMAAAAGDASTATGLCPETGPVRAIAAAGKRGNGVLATSAA
jgi:hypothetical protein